LRIFGAFASFLFLCSILSPFLEVSWFGLRTFVGSPGPLTFWSFRMTNVYFRSPDDLVMNELWFVEYWSDYANYRTLELGLAMSAVLVFLFGVQVLTVFFGALAVSRVSSTLLFSAAIVDVVTAFCMWLVSRAFIYPYFRYVFLAGFWLACVSVVLFFAASILSWRWFREEATGAK